MATLYPIEKSFGSYGREAEEYWTIEAGKMCENAIRLEHGFSARTGHLSAEPGGEGIRDLYYLGLCRYYDETSLQKFLEYTQKHENFSSMEKEQTAKNDKYIDNMVALEIQYLQKPKLHEIFDKILGISRLRLKTTITSLDKLNATLNSTTDKNEVWRLFLFALPKQIREAFVSIQIIDANLEKILVQKNLSVTPQDKAVMWRHLIQQKENNIDSKLIADFLEKMESLQPLFKAYRDFGLSTHAFDSFANAIKPDALIAQHPSVVENLHHTDGSPLFASSPTSKQKKEEDSSGDSEHSGLKH